MIISNNLLNRFKIAAINKGSGINQRLAVYKGKYIQLVTEFNQLSDTKQKDLINDLLDIQSEFITECANNQQAEIEIPKLGRIRIKPNKKEILRIKEEGKRNGDNYEEISKKIAKQVRANKIALSNQVAVLKPKFKFKINGV